MEEAKKIVSNLSGAFGDFVGGFMEVIEKITAMFKDLVAALQGLKEEKKD